MSEVEVKTCRSGIHPYILGGCPECHKLATNRWRQNNLQRHKNNLKQWRQSNSKKCADHNKRAKLKSNYNITIEQYNKMFKNQKGCCAICYKHQTQFKQKFAVDHDHSCCAQRSSCGKCIRGLLCHKCNKGLGFFEDNSTFLNSAVSYVKGEKNAV